MYRINAWTEYTDWSGYSASYDYPVFFVEANTMEEARVLTRELVGRVDNLHVTVTEVEVGELAHV